MDLKDVIDSVGIKVASRQSERVFKVSRNLTRNTLAEDHAGLKALLASKNDVCWRLTSVPTIQKSGDGFRLCLSKRKSTNNHKSHRRKMSKVHTSRHEAEKSMFKFRLGFESKTSQDLVGKKIESLINLNDHTISTQQDNQLISDLSSSSSSSSSKKTKVKSAEMSASFSSLHNPNVKSRNPMSAGKLSLVSVKTVAKKVQNSIRNFLSCRRYIRSKQVLKSKQLPVMAKLKLQLESGDKIKLIDGGDDKNFCATLSSFQRDRIGEQAQHVFQALVLHNEKLERNWDEACELASRLFLNKYSACTIQLWCRLCVASNFKFPVSKIGKVKVTNNLNPFGFIGETKIRDNNDIFQEFRTYALENLEGLTINIVRNKFQELLQPLITQTPEVLVTYRISLPLSMCTASRWMEENGFRHCKQKKSHVIDIHERKDVVKDRIKYLEKFFQDELAEPCWITFERHKFQEIMNAFEIDEGKVEELLKSAYVKEEILEFHVDDNEAFDNLIDDLPLPGSISIRCASQTKTRIVLGQDESVHVPHSLKDYYWTFEDVCPLRTKTDGMGVMISLFVSREFGCGFGQGAFDKVKSSLNEKRKNKNYLSEHAAMESHGKLAKPPLETDPCYAEFLCGKNRSGYWDGNHVALQLEDVCDLFDDLFDKEKHKLVLELDHSQTHKRFTPDAFVVNDFNLFPGGKVPVVRDIEVGPEKENLGAFYAQNKLLHGEVERHVFLPGDNPPFINPTMPQFDAMGPEKSCALTKAELVEALKAKGLRTDGKVKEVTERARAAGIPTNAKKAKMIAGCMNKPIGLMELLCRRGFIDPSNPNKPSIKELVKLAKDVPDFKNEKSEIELSMDKLNVEIVFTPKAHCELAGRGIEYIWGVSKTSFRRENATLSTSDRVTTLNSRVKKNIYQIPKKTFRACTRKTREYKKSYINVHRTNNSDEPFRLKEIEKMKKQLKGKRCALDQDNSFIVSLFEKMDSKLKSEKGQTFKFKQD